MNRFQGLGVALATPFSPGQELDLPAFRRLVRHAARGADFLVVLGSTGEAATVCEGERDALIEAALEEAGGLPVAAGTGHNATRQAAAWTRRAKALGAQGALVVTPYYNKPTPEGLAAHFAALAEAAPDFPLIAYNVPGRTGLNLSPDSLARLWENPQVIALKESSGDLAQMGRMLAALPQGKSVLAGDDALALPAIAMGAAGLVSVAGGVLPHALKSLVDHALAGARAEAIALHARLLPFLEALFLETNPIPLKAALATIGLCGDTLRLPLTRARGATRERLQPLLAGLLAPDLVEA